jgi:hypothetical protein
MRKEVKVVAFDRSPLEPFTLRFSNIDAGTHPVRDLELLSQLCFCHLKTIIVYQYRYSVGGL